MSTFLSAVPTLEHYSVFQYILYENHMKNPSLGEICSLEMEFFIFSWATRFKYNSNRHKNKKRILIEPS